MLDTSEVTTELTSARAIFQEYEEQRRLRLMQTAAPLLCGLAGLFALSLIAYLPFVGHQPRVGTALILDIVLVGLTAVALGIATYFTRIPRLQLAANIVTITLIAAIFAVIISWNLIVAIDPFGITTISFFGLGIMMVGLLSDQRGVVITTIAANLATILLFAVKLPQLAADSPFVIQMTLYLPLTILGQWAFAGLILAILRNFQQTFRDLSLVYTQIKQIDEIKDQFITSVNHELRNPIMAMSGYIEVLRLRQRQMDADRRAEILDQAGNVGDRIAALLESILDARRLDQGADDYTPQAVPVREIVEASARLVNPRDGKVAGRDLRVYIAPDLVVWGDEVRLQQVLTNLISNAIKYSPPDASIEITGQVLLASATPRLLTTRPLAADRRVVELTLRDYGLGIPPAQIPLLFRRFVRLPRDLASTTVGNGLGLHLCKVFIEAMRGQIWVESTGVEGEGSTFHITLPLPPDEYALASSPPTPLDPASADRL